MTPAPADRRAASAVRILERVFDPITQPLRFRLWEGTTARVGGSGECDFEVVFRSPDIFRRILRRPTPLRFGEAFVNGQIDIEGDIFSAMRAATEIEELRLSLGTRLAVLAELLRT
jgi:cyclopropane-fatty-acyl-phospholipid synthase